MAYGYDVRLILLEAEGLKRAELFIPADPYVKLTIPTTPYPTVYISRVRRKSKHPVWNETILISNLPAGAELAFAIWDKDRLTEHTELGNTSYMFMPQGETGSESPQLLVSKKGVLSIQVDYTASEAQGRTRHVGPVRFSRRSSRTAGAVVTGSFCRQVYEDAPEEEDDSPAEGDADADYNTCGLYSAWKIHLCDIPYHFSNRKQHWNVKYDTAIEIFTNNSRKRTLVNRHCFLYKHNKTSKDGELKSADDFFKLIQYGRRDCQMRYYTYVIMEHELRFSETGATYFIDQYSKHAMHSGCAEEVYYAGEFCVMESDTNPGQYRIVIDNQSGTYAPAVEGLKCVESLLKANFPGIEVETLTRDDPKLKEYHQMAPSRVKPKRTITEKPGVKRSTQLLKKPTWDKLVDGLDGMDVKQ